MEMVLLGGIAGFLIAKLILVTRINIHWDEFYYLSFVHDFLRGELSTRLQTFHIHLFSWLAALPVNETGQVIAGRSVMAILGIGTAALIYRIARHFMDRPAALFAVFAYVSTPVVIEHGASFRVDPLITFMSLLAVAVILRAPQRPAAAAAGGVILGLALLLTIKAVFFAGVAGLLIWHLADNWRGGLRCGIVFGTALLTTTALLYLGHISFLAATSDAAITGYLQGTASKVLLAEGLLPRWKELLQVVASNVLFFLMAVEGARIAWHRRGNDWTLLILALPLLTPLFYRNAYPYYFALILPAAAVFAGLSFEKRRHALGRLSATRRRLLIIGFVFLQLAVLLAGNWRYVADSMAGQRRTIAGIHEIFTEPTPYMDGYGVIAGFPRVGFFMSSWGMDKYRAGNHPVLAAVITQAQPPLLLADSIPLYHGLFRDVATAPSWHLLEEDQAFLKENYIQHWGLVFVAGKILQTTDPMLEIGFDVVIAGSYRVEASQPVWLDGVVVHPDEAVSLIGGHHTLRTDTADTVTLRWAAAAMAPAAAAVDLPDFFGIVGRPRN